MLTPTLNTLNNRQVELFGLGDKALNGKQGVVSSVDDDVARKVSCTSPHTYLQQNYESPCGSYISHSHTVLQGRVLVQLFGSSEKIQKALSVRVVNLKPASGEAPGAKPEQSVTTTLYKLTHTLIRNLALRIGPLLLRLRLTTGQLPVRLSRQAHSNVAVCGCMCCPLVHHLSPCAGPTNERRGNTAAAVARAMGGFPE